MSALFSVFRLFDGYRSVDISNPGVTVMIELRDATGAYLLDADDKQLTVTA